MNRYLVINADRERVEESFSTVREAIDSATQYADDDEDGNEFYVALIVGTAKRPFPPVEFTKFEEPDQ